MSVVIVVIEVRFSEVKVEESLLNEPSPRPSSKMAGELSSPFPLLSFSPARPSLLLPFLLLIRPEGGERVKLPISGR